MQDVEELGRVKEKLAEIPGSSLLLQALFALAPVGLQIYDVGGRSLLTNQAFRDLFGSEPPPEYNILRDEIAAANGVLGLVQRAFAGEVITTPPLWYDPRALTQVKVTAGRRIAMSSTFFPLRDAAGAVTHVGMVFKDMTAELERQAQEERARAEAEFLAACSVTLAGSLDIEATFRSLAKLVIPHLCDWCVIDMVAEDGALRRVATAHARADREALLERLYRYPPGRGSRHPAARVIVTGKPELLRDVDARTVAVNTVDEEHRALVNALAPCSSLALPLVARERILGAITLTFAESGRQYGPDELRVATDLSARAALAADNARLYQEAQQAVRIREDFLSVAGHELRTPLTAARLNLERLGSALRSLPADERGKRDAAAHRLQDAERLVVRLGGLIDQLLDVSRLGAGRLVLELAEVDLSELVGEAVGRLEPEAAGAGTPLRLSSSPAIVGRWDRARVDQVVSNVLSNALKYGAGQPVDVEVRAGSADAVVVVRDRGIGIAAENQARIFEKFERAISEREFGGLGLGLWICREIVSAMGGRIEVASAPGAGATFTVTLPRA
ncbi:MAG TPA: GAF domain-containing sensor histidine kinase [Polyangia bacterium]|nr:GAF domain-containing sensor histidine kinase [Polyangia bacterium]